MTAHRFFNWIAAGAIVACWMAIAVHMDRKLLDGDQRHEASIPAEVKFAKAARTICGSEAAWEVRPDGSLQCFMHTGRRTITAKAPL
jgi:hypothetical protein